MFKGTPETIAQRREEIVNACEQLYQTMSFKDITLKEIGNVTSFSRPTIYNYFHTKEEIFLALYECEYERWNADLENILNSDQKYNIEQIADLKKLLRGVMESSDAEETIRRNCMTILHPLDRRETKIDFCDALKCAVALGERQFALEVLPGVMLEYAALNQNEPKKKKRWFRA